MVCFHPRSLEPSMWFAQSGCLVKLLDGGGSGWHGRRHGKRPHVAREKGVGTWGQVQVQAPSLLLLCCVTGCHFLSLSLSVLTCERGTRTLTVCEIGLRIKDSYHQALGLRTEAWNRWLDSKGHREAAFGTDAHLLPDSPRSRAFLFPKGN